MRIGVDLGGTKIETIALDDDGVELVRRRVPTPQGDYDGTITAVVGLVASVEAEVGESGSVGIGTPGSLSPTTGLMRNSNSTMLNGRALDTDLAAALGRQIRLANDANCFALSEAVDGGGAGARVVFGVIIGTGVGGGLVVDGSVLVGPNAVAGEWGHNPLPGTDLRGRKCYCGRFECIERYLSGPALEAEYTDVSGRSSAAVDIAAGIDSDDTAAAVLDRYIDRLAMSLASVINIVDPDVIVLGGGMSNVASLYDGVPARWDQWVFSDAVSTRLVQNVHGDSSGVRGAAWLWD